MGRTRPAHAVPEKLYPISWIFKKRWVRELILLPKTISGKRRFNKTEDYGVFKDNNCVISHLEQSSYMVTNLEESKEWFANMGFTLSRTCPAEPHPDIKGHTLTCAYFSAEEQDECMVLIEQRDADNRVVTPSIEDIHHAAYEITDNIPENIIEFKKAIKSKGITPCYGPAKHNNSKPDGDGESGGNFALYYYSPDYHHIEFCAEMDNIDNYEGRYGTGLRTVSNDQYLN